MKKESADMKNNSVSVISLKEALQLLELGEREGIDHVVSVTRDPRNPDRILAISAVEAATN